MNSHSARRGVHGAMSSAAVARNVDSSTHAAPPAAPFPSAQPIPVESATTFSFVVFLCNRSPIFHSNRIPLHADTPPYTPGDVVYMGPAEEVAQQKLQELAFPLRFGCKSSSTRSGPLWNSRLESVRKKDKVRYHRLIIASTFVVSVAGESGMSRTMQKNYVAVALVVTCPANKPYHLFLMENFTSVMRNMLHILLSFAMKETQIFFWRLPPNGKVEKLVTDMERGPRALKTHRTLGAILSNAFTHKFAIPRLHSRQDLLNVPYSFAGSFGQQPFTRHSVEKLLSDALHTLCSFSETYTSRIISGLLSLSNWERWGSGQANVEEQQLQHGIENDAELTDTYSDYWKHMEKTRESQSSSSSRDGNNGDNSHTNGMSYLVLEQCENICRSSSHNNNTGRNGVSASIPATAAASAVSVASAAGVQRLGRSELNSASRTNSVFSATAHSISPSTDIACPLSSHRVGRVVIFSTDPELARCLLIVSAFFFRDYRATVGTSSRLQDDTPFAGKVPSCIHPSFPVQWVEDEYDEARVQPLLSSRYSVDNLLLIIAPRSGVCNRIRLEKRFSLNPILVEKFKKGFQPQCPFQAPTLSVIHMRPDKAVSFALQEARRLQKKNEGAVNCAEFFECFISWLVRQSQICHLQPNCAETVSSSSVFSSRSESASYTSLIGSYMSRLFSSRSRPNNGGNKNNNQHNRTVLFSANTVSSPIAVAAAYWPRAASEDGSERNFGCVQENSQLMSLLAEFWKSDRETA